MTLVETLFYYRSLKWKGFLCVARCFFVACFLFFWRGNYANASRKYTAVHHYKKLPHNPLTGRMSSNPMCDNNSKAAPLQIAGWRCWLQAVVKCPLNQLKNTMRILGIGLFLGVLRLAKSAPVRTKLT